MAERYLFFNSAPGDIRKYQANDFATYFSTFMTSGIVTTSTLGDLLRVRCEGDDLRTYVCAGSAILGGHFYQNTSDLYLEHAIPEATMDRIDRIVLRLDKRNQSRFIKLFVKQGTAAANPFAPVLQRDEFIYEVSLARILVRANTSTLRTVDLLDERLDELLCGIVQLNMKLPTSQFQEQWDAFMAEVQDDGFATPSYVDNAIVSHSANDVLHITAQERSSWNAKETPFGAQLKVEHDSFKTVKTSKDSNGIYTTIEHRRNSDNTLIRRSVLSGGTSPAYTTRTVTFYGVDGVTLLRTDVYTLTYDSDGELVSEV
ncbi:hypothetical protein [Mangrovibacillus cuniculi]|uniref:Uncharacterized protein n=1 Tax=Mangrovibacillus cuniculi TaxID=2593652 RepID=A0A7S8HG54_9BACI|nr:hypothetical protein [Mangrovibacillus cuniculi]QPC47105.1 hypothetical protein G8O30_09065 [Mangrovibacillus cuniculi]